MLPPTNARLAQVLPALSSPTTSTVSCLYKVNHDHETCFYPINNEAVAIRSCSIMLWKSHFYDYNKIQLKLLECAKWMGEINYFGASYIEMLTQTIMKANSENLQFEEF